LPTKGQKCLFLAKKIYDTHVKMLCQKCAQLATTTCYLIGLKLADLYHSEKTEAFP